MRQSSCNIAIRATLLLADINDDNYVPCLLPVQLAACILYSTAETEGKKYIFGWHADLRLGCTPPRRLECLLEMVAIYSSVVSAVALTVWHYL